MTPIPCPLCQCGNTGTDAETVETTYCGRVITYLKPFLICYDCKHEFADFRTLSLAVERIQEAHARLVG